MLRGHAFPRLIPLPFCAAGGLFYASVCDGAGVGCTSVGRGDVGVSAISGIGRQIYRLAGPIKLTVPKTSSMSALGC
jgi:hypothetical protein